MRFTLIQKILKPKKSVSLWFRYTEKYFVFNKNIAYFI